MSLVLYRYIIIIYMFGDDFQETVEFEKEN